MFFVAFYAVERSMGIPVFYGMLRVNGADGISMGTIGSLYIVLFDCTCGINRFPCLRWTSKGNVTIWLQCLHSNQ
jgi:hypothetical protein